MNARVTMAIFFSCVTAALGQSYPRELVPGSPPISITLTNQAIGLYSFMVYGQIAPSNRTTLNQVWNPCPMDFEVRDSGHHLLAHGEMLLKQAFSSRRMQGFHFHIDAQTNVTATFSLPARAMETAWIDHISLVDPLAGLPDVAVKTSQNLFHGANEQDRMLTEKRERRDDLIWNSLPLLNTPLQIDSINKSFEKPPPGANVDRWVTASFSKTIDELWLQPASTFSPLDLLDTDTKTVFYQSNILAWPVQPLPGANPDYGWGSFFPHEGAYYARRAELLGYRYILFAGAVMNSRGSLYGLNLGERYLTNGDPGIGHDAAMTLVRLAYDWPALEMNLHDVRQCIEAPDMDYNQDWSNPERRNGKMMYTGFSGPQTTWLFNTYDQVFPYIKNNRVFADAVHRHIPWVNTPQDVIRLLDRYLVFASVMDATNGSHEIDPADNIQLLAGKLLGPSPYTANLFNLTDNVDKIYPISGSDQELYATALSRSGVYYIASFMTYAFGSAEELIEKASLIRDAVAGGVSVPMNISDVSKYPKVRSAGSFLMDMWVAGGFPFMAGDASGGTHAGLESSRVLRAAGMALFQAFNLYGDPRHAWVLKHVAGITTNRAISASAALARDPILFASNRVVPDYGAILEMEPDEPDVLKKTSATIRLGVGAGHAHADYLDLNMFGMGLPLSVNLACRNEGADFWSRPPSAWSYVQNHALGHNTNNPAFAGPQNGEPWLRAFAPPLVCASYYDPSANNGFRLDRDTIMMQVGSTETYYAFDLQRVTGDTYHTWCFHGCESCNLALNVPMHGVTSNRWIDRTLEGTQFAGPSSNVLQATWIMTREKKSFAYKFEHGGSLATVACEPEVLGGRYNPALPPVHVRATLLGRGNDTVLQGNAYSAAYHYCFPFLWVQSSNEPVSVYPAIYEWYRGNVPVVAAARLLNRDPLEVEVITTTGQTDTYEFTTNYCLAVSRNRDGLRWVKLTGSTQVSLPDLTLNAVSSYDVAITDINYSNRTLTTSGPLPNNPSVIAGNEGRRIFLQLTGSGTSFSWSDDLLVQEGRITHVHVTGPDSITVTSDQALVFDGYGNRNSAAMTVSTEDGLWNFRGGKAIKRPAGILLTPGVFTDANGDGRIDMKTYEIGIGDHLGVPAEVTIRRNSGGWLVKNNIPLSGAIHSSNSAALNLPESAAWQTVTNRASSSYAKSPVL